MAYRSSSISSAAGGTRTSLTVAVPAGVQADDIVFLIGNHDGGSGAFTWPAGFTQLDSSALGSPDGQFSAIAWKRLTGADSGTYTVSFGDTFAMVIAVAFSGRHTTDAPTNSKATSTSNNSSPVTVTASTVTAVAGDDLLYVNCPDTVGTSATSCAPPSGYTERQDGQDQWSVVSAATKDNASAGATGSVAGTFTGEGGGWTAYLIRIPAAAAAGTTVTPGVLALTTSTFAPKANLQLNGASPTALSTTGLAPQANLRINGASPTALTLSTFAPTVGLGPFTATPDVLALTLSTFAPTIGVSVIVTPGVLSLSLATFAPQANLTINAASPTALSITGLAPQSNLAINGASPTALSLSTFAATVGLGPLTVTPDVTALTLSTFAPSVSAGGNVTVTPGVLALSLSTFAPQLKETLTPALVALTLATLTPVLNLNVPVALATLSLTGLAPGLALTVIPGAVALVTATFAPTIDAPQTVTPDVLALAITVYVPVITNSGVVLTPVSIPMTGSLTPVAMSGSGLATMTGSYGLDSLTGSVGD